MTETIVHLKPRAQWRPGMTLDALRAEMSRAVQLPGVANIWTMPIINRIDMLTTGIRSEVGVKIFGTDLATLEEPGARRSRRCAAGARRQQRLSEQVTSGQYLNIAIDREAAARYGIGVGDDPGRHRDRHRRDDADHDHRRAPALSGARALRARVSRRSAGARRACSSPRPSGAQIPLGQLARHRARARPGHDLVARTACCSPPCC